MTGTGHAGLLNVELPLAGGNRVQVEGAPAVVGDQGLEALCVVGGFERDDGLS